MARKQNVAENNNNNNSNGNGDKKNGLNKGGKRKIKDEDSDSSDCALNPSSNDSGLPGEFFYSMPGAVP